MGQAMPTLYDKAQAIIESQDDKSLDAHGQA
jgi:hypothetical protein